MCARKIITNRRRPLTCNHKLDVHGRPMMLIHMSMSQAGFFPVKTQAFRSEVNARKSNCAFDLTLSEQL